MKKIFVFFTTPWVISLLGIIVLSLLIWYVGPLVSIAGVAPLESDVLRWILIIAIVAIWLGRLAFKKIMVVLADKQLKAGISQSDSNEPDYGAEEVAQLKERFEESIELLNRSRGQDGRRAGSLYDLPWYVIIGPPGSGKTTALSNSGLSFPLADRFGNDSLKGVGGTRNCDWWFSDKAVLLDTAGRYVTQDSRADVDSTAWFGFLDLLKKHRRRRPINGVLVAISVSELMVQNEGERTLHVRAIKKRIQELYQHFGMRFPVYVLLTKCDLIAGFMEFFDDLTKEERAQVWGMTFPVAEKSESPEVQGFGKQFDGLMQRIHDRVIGRLGKERDSHRRTLIYGFPQQLASLKETLNQFLQDIFRPSRYNESVMLRGVYFTCGTQEGTPIDQVMGSLARSFGLNQQALPSFGGQNRAYFITDLLTKVVIPESQVAGTNQRLERHRKWIQNAAYASAVGATVLCLGAWGISYNRNQVYIKDVANQVSVAQAGIDALSSTARDPVLALPPLNTIRDFASGLEANEQSVPWSLGFGLYQGDRLGAKARAAYQRLLNTIFLPRLLLRLEAQLKLADANPDYLFEGLKVYLMLSEQAHFNAETIDTWISLDWDQRRRRDYTAASVQDLNNHLQTLLASGIPALPMSLDERLISYTRKTLKQIPLAQRAYGRLKRVHLNGEIPSFRISDAGGPDTPLMFSRRSGQPLNAGVDGLFTYRGFHETFLPQSKTLSNQMAKERWVLGGESNFKDDKKAQSQLNADVQQLYYMEYIEKWESLLSDLTLAPVSNITRDVEILNIMSGPQSPLRNLLTAVSEETTLTRSNTSKLISDSVGRIESLKKRLTDVIGAGQEQKLPDVLGEKKGVVVERHFEQLNSLVAAQDNGAVPLDGLLMDINELYIYMNSIASATDRGQAALDAVKGNDALDNVIQKIQVSARRQPALVNDMMMAIATSSRNLAMGGAQAHLNAVWQANPLSFCRRAIIGRYPLARNSSTEITLADFNQFFGPTGIMNNFFKEYLAGFVDTSSRRWRWRGSGGLETKVLEQFRKAKVIRDTFFQVANQELGVRFELKPINMDSTITRFSLDLDGQKVSYTHGPIRMSALRWPGPGMTNQVQLQMLPRRANTASSVRKLGPWSWFRILDTANIRSTSRPERYRVTFNIGSRKARYELYASSTYNPFRLKELSKFRCYDTLL